METDRLREEPCGGWASEDARIACGRQRGDGEGRQHGCLPTREAKRCRHEIRRSKTNQEKTPPSRSEGTVWSEVR
jgi:hypothetical protein